MIPKGLRIHNILEVVQKVADPDYQNRAWVKGEIHWPCSFEELNCQFFDDCFIREFIEEEEKGKNYSKEQIQALKKLMDAFDKFGKKSEIYFKSLPLKIDESKVLIDPEWHEIRSLAKKVLQVFQEITYSIEDKEWWLARILLAISQYADTEKQTRMWISKTEVFYSTPFDFYRLLLYCNFDLFLDKYTQKFGLTQVQIAALKQFQAAIKKSPFQTTHHEGLLKNPEWVKIQKLAKNALDAFKK